MAREWEDAKKDAKKILGDKGKLPDDKALLTAAQASAKEIDAFHKKRDEFEGLISVFLGQMEKYVGAIHQMGARIEKDNLGLDPKNKDEAKKISDARNAMTGWLKDGESSLGDCMKGLTEAGRHLVLLGKYKFPAGMK